MGKLGKIQTGHPKARNEEPLTTVRITKAQITTIHVGIRPA